MPGRRRSLYFVAPGRVELREDSIPEPDADEVRVRTIVSAASPGTELLVYRGEAPSALDADSSIQSLSGTLEYPLQYGYAAVGRVDAVGADVDDAWLDRLVFAFNPHESHFLSSPSALRPVPDGIDPRRATLAPTVETAVNLALDGAPKIGERVVVFGQGPVGLATTAVLGSFPLERLVAVERLSERRERALALGATAAVAPESVAEAIDLPEGACEEGTGADLTYELSGNPAALDDAVSVTGYDGRIVVGSWYGTKPVELDLGGRFHRGRIELKSSQVSTIDPALRGRWDSDRRFDVAWNRLADLDADRLLTDVYPIEEAQTAYERLDSSPEETLGALFTYGDP